MISAWKTAILWTLKPFREGTHEIVSLKPWASASSNIRWSFLGKGLATFDVDIDVYVDVDVDVVDIEVDFVIADAMVWDYEIMSLEILYIDI